MENQNNESCCCSESCCGKSCSPWKYISILLIILVVGLGAYYFGTLKDKEKTDNTTKQTNTATSSDTNTSAGTSTSSSTTDTTTSGATQNSTDKYSGWSTLTDTKMGYTLRYPTIWTAKIEDGKIDENAPQYPNLTSYHFLSLAPSDQKWDLNIGIIKKDDTKIATSMRTGIGPVGIKTNGEIIKVAGSDVQMIEYVDNGKITEIFFGYAMGGSNYINNGTYKLSGYLSYYGVYKFDTKKGPVPDASNTTTRTSEPYLTVKKILESIQFTTSAETNGTDTSSNIYKNAKYGFQVSVPSEYKILTDKTNLYGWSNAVALLHKDGHSYAVAIQVWNTEAEYKKNLVREWGNITVKQVNGKFVTFLDNNSTGIAQKVAATFKAN